MESQYNPKEIEPKWQKIWEEAGLNKALNDSPKPKAYVLFEFPYPSGDRLHTGHGRSYCALDALARKKRMQGFNVLLPMGWDAFGLPAENYALKLKTTPQKTVPQNIANAKAQVKSWGLSVDWDREVNTTDPAYYKWTQWIFLKMYEKGLAYSADLPINWCPKCKIGLSNEEVVDGRCERCGTATEHRNVRQWVLKITAYAERLLNDLDTVDYLPKIAAQQRHWIGKSKGSSVNFLLSRPSSPSDPDTPISVFTTRVDTIYGVTAVVVSPEHPLIAGIIDTNPAVKDYVIASKKKSELERTELSKEKTGVFTGLYVKHPLTNEDIPVWVGDYVVGNYGGGAVMVVPAHDQRDFEFAEKYGLEIKPVVGVGSPDPSAPTVNGRGNPAPTGTNDVFVDYGVLVNSGIYSGLSSEEAITKITAELTAKNLGQETVHYHLRDWIFSRQHYWGEPIPLIHCDNCGVVPVPEADLPVILPEVANYEPSGTGESPLANIDSWVKVPCPKCGGSAKRDTDTMPNWAGSNWYFARYCDPRNDKVFADTSLLKKWLPVDVYNGGMEHTTLHLLYSRFVYKFLYDIGVAPTPEPYLKRRSHGMVLSYDGEKMSKSRGNVINPDDIVSEYGADTFRMYEMFMGPFDQAIAWNPQGVVGVNKFLHRVWRLVGVGRDRPANSGDPRVAPTGVAVLLNNLIFKIDSDLHEDTMKFNTAVAAFMTFLNEVEGVDLSQPQKETFLKLLAPFAPHMTDELWSHLGHKTSIHLEPWPAFDSKLVDESAVTIIIQINGKVRGKIEIARADSSNQALVTANALEMPKIREILGEAIPKKVVFVAGKLVNVVV